ncbi:MAG: amidase [Gammaproteobacteria bacterium]|nr:amidase [Gammaproteobacteria bacterium]
MTANQPDDANRSGLSVCQYLELMDQGTIDSKSLVQSYLKIIDESDDRIKAWATVDHDFALDQAKNRDSLRKRGMPTGSLHGIPIGVKDIIDTSDLPTQLGSEFFEGRQPQNDAAVIERLKEAGAVIMGKTRTTELAYMHPSVTRNPWNTDYSPGGSSSGSAAAVAMGQVPLALGSQTHGSVIRPASYCGVYGFKPSRGMISRRGVLQTSYHLDQMGACATSLEDIALLTDSLASYDASDPMCPLRPRPDCRKGLKSEVPIEPSLAWFDLPYASRYSKELVEGCEELIIETGAHIERIEAPLSFSGLIESHRIIYGYELYRSLLDLGILESSVASDTIRESTKLMGPITENQYHDALEAMHAAEDWFVRFFHDYDAVLTPSAPDIAPRFGEGTGDPCCSTIWTLAGLPCLSMPLLVGRDDMPIGIQLVGAREQDDRLFRTARWLLEYLWDK